MSAFSAFLLSLSPALYWPLDATDGATDQSGNGRNGTAVGPTIGGHVATSPGIVGEDASCTDFDGTDDYITSTYNPFTNGTSRTWTGWAYRDDSTVTHNVWGSAGSGDNLLLLGGGVTSLTFTTYGGGAEAETFAGFTTAAWVFWALVFDDPADTAACYLNGSLVSSQPHTSTYFASDGNWRLAANGAGGTPWNGKQAHVAIFESGLSADNVADLYAAASEEEPVTPPTLYVTRSSARLA